MEEHKFYESEKYKLDLTVMFGKGNEPTPEEFERKYLKRHGDDYQTALQMGRGKRHY